ncbi:TPA_asm: type-F conjugative transfer system pilin acetylase TraX [Salmonella enterica subsp. enterica serovar Muenchen]|nr:type-F conjugative transfer system pilin acetylase TraX [Salmonella enterica]EIF9058089.1 type-F conjugative transfer system pilin acetylase TraX [Salmonella enterica]HAE7669226.1 type-F conjugative transfer system pilin acetylase TraX [Salmonella enterica subsp. enterica serovar Muenchen]
MSPGKSVALHPFRPVLNFSALQRDVIRMAAFMAMMGDHIATAFQLDMPLLNMAGRCAFPLFAFAVVMQMTCFLQAATVLNGVAAFTALVGYLPLSSASYGIPGLLMLAGALLIWQVRDSLRPALFVVWLLLVALLNARHGDVMMLSGVILTLAVLFCVHGLVPASGRRLQAGRWFAPAYALHLLCIGFLVSVL